MMLLPASHGQVYHYEFDMTPNLINICQLVNRATNVIMADRLMFVISHNDDVNECTVSKGALYSCWLVPKWKGHYTAAG